MAGRDARPTGKKIGAWNVMVCRNSSDRLEACPAQPTGHREICSSSGFFLWFCMERRVPLDSPSASTKLSPIRGAYPRSCSRAPGYFGGAPRADMVERGLPN